MSNAPVDNSGTVHVCKILVIKYQCGW